MASWGVYFEPSSSASFVATLLTLATFQGLVGAALIVRSGATWRRVGLVAAILLAGQGWLIVWSGVLLLWRMNGFGH